MIRGLRLASIILCIISLILYGGVSAYTKTHTDNEGPKISMEEKEITVSTKAGEEELLSGISAVDEIDGDVSDLLVIESKSNFIEKGVRDITVAAFDKSGNVTKAVRRIKYNDYYSPKISLKRPLRVAENKLKDLGDAVSAWDCLDGDLTSYVQITSENPVSEITLGRYQMHITVSNSVGDVTDLEVPVEIYDYRTQNPKIEVLLSEYLVYTPVGEKVDYASYMRGISEDGTQYLWNSENPPRIDKESVTVNDKVNYRIPGIYEITYSAADVEGNMESVNQIVVVEK